MNVPPQFVPYDGRLGAPETGGDEDRIGLDTPFNEGFPSCDGKLEIGAPHIKPEFV